MDVHGKPLPSFQKTLFRHILLAITPVWLICGWMIIQGAFDYYQKEREEAHVQFQTQAQAALREINEDLLRLSYDLHHFIFIKESGPKDAQDTFEEVQLYVGDFWESWRNQIPTLELVYFGRNDQVIKRWGGLFTQPSNDLNPKAAALQKKYLQDVAYSGKPISYFDCTAACMYNVVTLANQHSKRFGKIKLSIPLDTIFTGIQQSYNANYAVALPVKGGGDISVSINDVLYSLFPTVKNAVFQRMSQQVALHETMVQRFAYENKQYAISVGHYEVSDAWAQPFHIVAMEDVTGRFRYLKKGIVGIILQAILILIALVAAIYLSTRTLVHRLSTLASSLQMVGDGEYRQARHMMRSKGIKSQTQELQTIDTATYQMMDQLEALNRTTNRQHQYLEKLAEEDQLTSLPNRRVLDRILKKHQFSEKRFSLCVIDIDYFKLINDTYGHDIGDSVLKAISQKLLATIGETGIVGRSGGDEFYIVITRYNFNTERVKLIAENVLKTCSKVQVAQGQDKTFDIPLTLSIGIAHFPEHATDLDELLSKADAAMYENKRERTGGFHVYDGSEQMIRQLMSSQHSKLELTDAISNNNLELHLQPILRLKSRSVLGFEGLARIRVSENKVRVASDFIDGATRSGSIGVLDLAILNLALTTFDEMNDRDLFFINISSQTLLDAAFFNTAVRASSNITGFSDRVVFELSEKSPLLEDTRTIKVMYDLSEYGYRFALDDFGKGYTSILQILELPIHFLKLDRSLVSSLDFHPEISHSINAITSMCHDLGIEVIAEGIESESVLSTLEKLNIDYVQGFLFGQPALINKMKAELPSNIIQFNRSKG